MTVIVVDDASLIRIHAMIAFDKLILRELYCVHLMELHSDFCKVLSCMVLKQTLLRIELRA